MSGNVLPRSALKVPLSLGLGRYVCQLKRLTFKFCKSRSDSGGVRDFIEQEIVNFAKANPAVTVYVKPRRHRSPLLVAEYLNGNWQYLRMAKMTSEEISVWARFMLTRSGENIMPIYKPRSSHAPSIQGMWSPLDSPEQTDHLMTPEEIIKNLNKLSVCDFPWDESAQSHLLNLHRQRQRSLCNSEAKQH